MSIYTNYFNGPSELWHYRENDACKNMIAVAKVVSMLTIAIPLMIGLAWCISSLCSGNVTERPPRHVPIREIERVYHHTVKTKSPEDAAWIAEQIAKEQAVAQSFALTIFDNAFQDAICGNLEPLKAACEGSSEAVIKTWLNSRPILANAIDGPGTNEDLIAFLIDKCPKDAPRQLFKPDSNGYTPLMRALRFKNHIRLRWLLHHCPKEMLPDLFQSSRTNGQLKTPLDEAINNKINFRPLIYYIFEMFKEFQPEEKGRLCRLFIGETHQKTYWPFIRDDLDNFICLFKFLPVSLRPILFQPGDIHPLEKADGPFYRVLYKNIVKNSEESTDESDEFSKISSNFILNSQERESFMNMLVQANGNNQTFVFDALSRGKGKEVEQLLLHVGGDTQEDSFPIKYLPLLFASNSEGEPPLIWAIKNKGRLVKHLLVNKEVTEDLLMQSDKSGTPPILWALMQPDSRPLSPLIEFFSGKTLIQFERGGETICSLAIKKGCQGSNIVTLLKDLEENDIQTQMQNSWKELLALLAKEGDYESIEWYFDHCGPQTHLDQTDEKGNGVLHWAIQAGVNKSLNFFFDKWPKDSKVPKNHLNQSPLQMEGENGTKNQFVIQWPGDLEDLIQAMDETICGTPKCKRTLFSWAIECGRDSLINKMIELCNDDVGKLAELLTTAPTGETALYLTAKTKNLTLLQKLREILTKYPQLKPLFQHPQFKQYSPLRAACVGWVSKPFLDELLDWYPTLVDDALFYPNDAEGSVLAPLVKIGDIASIDLVYDKCPKHLKSMLFKASAKGNTLIHFAFLHNSQKTIPYLIYLYPPDELQKILVQNPTLLDSLTVEELKAMVTKDIRGGLIFTALFYKLDTKAKVSLVAEYQHLLNKDENPLGLSLHAYDTFLRIVDKARQPTDDYVYANRFNETIAKFNERFPDRDEIFRLKMTVKAVTYEKNPHFNLLKILAGKLNEVDLFLLKYKRAPYPSLEKLKLFSYPDKPPQEGYDITLAFERLKKQLVEIPTKELAQLENIVKCAKEKKSEQYKSFKEETFTPLARHLEWIFFKLESQKHLSEDDINQLGNLASYGEMCPTPWCTCAQEIYRALYPADDKQSLEDMIHTQGVLFRQNIFSTVVRTITNQAVRIDKTLDLKVVREFYQNIHYQNFFYTKLYDKMLPGGQNAADPELPNNLDIGIFKPTEDYVRTCFARHDTDEALIHWYTTHFNAEDKFELREELRVWMNAEPQQAYNDEFQFTTEFILNILVKANVFQEIPC